MQTERAEQIFATSVTHALGLMELAEGLPADGPKAALLGEKVLEALRRFTEDEDAVTALRELELESRYEILARIAGFGDD